MRTDLYQVRENYETSYGMEEVPVGNTKLK